MRTFAVLFSGLKSVSARRHAPPHHRHQPREVAIPQLLGRRLVALLDGPQPARHRALPSHRTSSPNRGFSRYPLPALRFSRGGSPGRLRISSRPHPSGPNRQFADDGWASTRITTATASITTRAPCRYAPLCAGHPFPPAIDQGCPRHNHRRAMAHGNRGSSN